MAINLEPSAGRVLVELRGEYANIAVNEKKWDAKQSGVVLKVGDKDQEHLIGKRIYWDEFGVEVSDNHAFIKVEEIAGYSNE